jgi:hypothetical protein
VELTHWLLLSGRDSTRITNQSVTVGKMAKMFYLAVEDK